MKRAASWIRICTRTAWSLTGLSTPLRVGGRPCKRRGNVSGPEVCRRTCIFTSCGKGLRSLGYEIENNVRNFEIKHVPKSVIALFSKRHQQIEAEAQRQAAEGYIGDMGELRTRIAHERRRRKMKNSTAEELRSYWKQQIAGDDYRALENLCQPGRAADTGRRSACHRCLGLTSIYLSAVQS